MNFYRIIIYVIVLMTGFVLYGSVWATAPRFSPTMFEKRQDHAIEIYACEFQPYMSSNLSSGGVHSELLQAVFKEVGLKIDLKILPAKSLIKYALTQDNAVAIIGYDWQSTEEARKQEIWITFAMITINNVWEKAAPIIFNKKNEKGLLLANKFKNGLNKLQQNGTYIKILQKYYREKDSLELFMQNLQIQQKETEKNNIWK